MNVIIFSTGCHVIIRSVSSSCRTTDGLCRAKFEVPFPWTLRNLLCHSVGGFSRPTQSDSHNQSCFSVFVESVFSSSSRCHRWILRFPSAVITAMNVLATPFCFAEPHTLLESRLELCMRRVSSIVCSRFFQGSNARLRSPTLQIRTHDQVALCLLTVLFHHAHG